jgi:hypothetical protein
MDLLDQFIHFYKEKLPGSVIEKNYLKAPCPFCSNSESGERGTLVVYVKPDSFFAGYFRCLNRCRPGGFPLHFGRLLGIEPNQVPGYVPEREPFVREIVYPIKNLKQEIIKFVSLMTESEYAYFKEFGVPKAVVDEMNIGYNGRYLVYPYVTEDGNSYAARCILPNRQEDNFWHGDENFTSGGFQVFGAPEIERCEGGALFVTEGEDNLLALKALGYPGIAVPSAGDLEYISTERLEGIENIFMVVNNTPEAYLAARDTATRIGFKVRILMWPRRLKRGYNLTDLAKEKGREFRTAVSSLIQTSKAFSPFTSPDTENRKFLEIFSHRSKEHLRGLSSGFVKLDRALGAIQGINIMGGPPKAGKSCFYMQVSTEMARRKTPVIYYDFENGRMKIYARTLCRISRLTEKEIRQNHKEEDINQRLDTAKQEFRQLLQNFRVVTDRKLNPDIMRRQIDFLQHETRKDYAVVVIDSLHKLPFKDLSDRRTGIDAWLRQMEAIRDEQNVSFFVISELSRGEGGRYAKKPDLGAFKESGDIEYSADNAMIFLPDWDPVDPISSQERLSSLWLVASRENSPGKIASYRLDFPYWGFSEK